MKPNPVRSAARKIMMEFADLTGLSASGKAPRRYLWTDAFAVCNFLELYRQTNDEKFKDLALRLVDQVHNLLGRHRDDDPRTGWISGLEEEEGKRHPTKGGLRIGKALNERKPEDPFDEELEWDRDGQYYHYLTKWMHALHRVSRVTGDATHHRWAVELAKTAHARFTYPPLSGGRKRMVWKMSIDLSHPLVPSMGHHDPLDGFITCSELQAAPAGNLGKQGGQNLSGEIAELADICEGKNWVTDDPLGIGGLLDGAYRVAQLIGNGYFQRTDLLETLLDSSLTGLESYGKRNPWKLPAHARLAFRELGLSIGLRAVERLQGMAEKDPDLLPEKLPLHSRLERLMGYAPWSETIETFWMEKTHKEGDTWTAHRDINMVMLATSLAPDGYLTF